MQPQQISSFSQRSLVRENRCLLFDWGDTVMRTFPGYSGPMADWPRVEAVKNAPKALAALHETWMLALATNAAESNEEQIWKALRRVGLDRYIDKVYCFRKIGHKKPSQAFFAYALDDLTLDASSVFMVGDDFESDVDGAIRCGIRAIWFNEHSLEERRAEMYRTVHDLLSLPEVLRTFDNYHPLRTAP